jgi:N-methylhydantoinase A
MPPAARKKGARIAVDIGGTFTDLVLLQDGRQVATAKVLTTPGDASVAVEAGIGRLLEHVAPEDVTEVVHGTTLASNALIERKGATTALVTTKGFRDVMTIRRELRYDLYDLFLEMPDPLVPRRLRWEVRERILADGSVDTALDAEEVAKLVRRIGREGVEAVAVSLLHSYRNPDHERIVAEVLRREIPHLHLSLSSEVSPEVGEFARTSTVIANAYVLPLVARYLEMLQKRLEAVGLRGPLLIMLSTGGGGLAGAETAKRFPVRLLESGPAAGAVSAGFWGGRAGRKDVLAFDMGGTTAKACLIEKGQPLVSREFEAARVYRFTKGSGVPIRVPVIDLMEIGAGGGSIARVGPFGLPKVGPESTGADPGPAAYGQGGAEPTVTDADLVLGYLNPDYFLGGEIRLRPDLARAALQTLGRELGMSVPDAAAAIHRVVNENMAAAARMHAVERGRDLRRFALVATGGAGPVHAWGVARALRIGTVIIPPGAGVASAFGMLTAAPGFEFARSLPSPLASTKWSQVRRAVSAMIADGTRHLAATGVPREQVQVALSADVHHKGQGEPVTVELGEGLGPEPARQVEEAFQRGYAALYGGRPPGVEAEVMTWRVKVSGPVPEVDVRLGEGSGEEPVKGSRPVWFAETDGNVEAMVLDRYRLRPGAQVTGPCVIEEAESTAVVGPGGTGHLDPFGNLIVVVP